MRTLVIHEMYEVLRRHSATVRFRRGARPDIIGTTHISPPQCVKLPPVRFPVSYLHFSLRSWSLPRPNSPSMSSRASTASPSTATPQRLFIPLPTPPTWHTTRRRRDDCTSLPVKFFSSVEYGSPDRDESIREMPLARLERQSKRRSKYWPTIFYLFPMLRRAIYFDKQADTWSWNWRSRSKFSLPMCGNYPNK